MCRIETEREFLRPLPSPPELAVWARVKLHPDCHVHFEKTCYFALVRQHLWLRAHETTVQLLAAGFQANAAVYRRGPGEPSRLGRTLTAVLPDGSQEGV